MIRYDWRKSSYSGGQGNCVEVAPLRDGVVVRDSKNPSGSVLRFSADAWQAFVSNIKADKLGASGD
ncbi:MAG TPA: DUF397 domain-containing protein [Streptosporangiaceae bacterium]